MSEARVSYKSQMMAIETELRGFRVSGSALLLRESHLSAARDTIAEIDRDKDFINRCRRHRERVSAMLDAERLE